MGRDEGGRMGRDEGGRMGRDGGEMEWSGMKEGGEAELTHLSSSLLMSVHVHSPLFVSHGGHFGWWWLAHVVVRGSWVTVKGTCHCFGDHVGGGSSLLGGHHCLWALGGHHGCHHLCQFMGAGRHLWVVAAVVVLEGGGHCWVVVVVFVGSPHHHGQTT